MKKLLSLCKARIACKAFCSGFTLVEVLITLGIIGVVAALVMPFVIDKFQEKQHIVMYKKIFNELSQISQKLDFEYDGSYVNECNTFDDACFRDLFAKN